MATDSTQAVDSATVEVSDTASGGAYVSPLVDFLLIAAAMSVLALGAASVIML